mmetsp:Transcript_25612/g.40889  ORF Transcript_25612/g.40889 Transcript_25612/m.40889 type:complete len:496 (-) Transcript_25612:42-1529(-)
MDTFPPAAQADLTEARLGSRRESDQNDESRGSSGNRNSQSNSNNQVSAVCRTLDCENFCLPGYDRCRIHKGRRRCEVADCGKFAQAPSKYCKSHGGGYRCNFTNCTKSAAGSVYRCLVHTSDIVMFHPQQSTKTRCCQIPGCNMRAAVFIYLCKAHGGGRRCSFPNCSKSACARSKFCVSHGGGRRCSHPGCTKSAVGATEACVQHGGGRRCAVEDCEKSARSGSSYCQAHRSKIEKGRSPPLSIQSSPFDPPDHATSTRNKASPNANDASHADNDRNKFATSASSDGGQHNHHSSESGDSDMGSKRKYSDLVNDPKTQYQDSGRSRSKRGIRKRQQEAESRLLRDMLSAQMSYSNPVAQTAMPVQMQTMSSHMIAPMQRAIQQYFVPVHHPAAYHVYPPPYFAVYPPPMGMYHPQQMVPAFFPQTQQQQQGTADSDATENMKSANRDGTADTLKDRDNAPNQSSGSSQFVDPQQQPVNNSGNPQFMQQQQQQQQ